MKINRGNIEEWMFRYHEGMLTESDKKKVLAYVSADEELTEEFRLWSVTKLPIRTSTVYPDLSEKLFKKDPFYQTVRFKYVSYFLLGMGLTGIVFWLFWGATPADSELHTSLPKQSLSILPTAPSKEGQKANDIVVRHPKKKNIPHYKVPAQYKQSPKNLPPIVDTLEDWTAEPLHIEAIGLQDSTLRPAFDQRQITYSKLRLKGNRLVKTVNPPKKGKINFKPQRKFKEEGADF